MRPSSLFILCWSPRGATLSTASVLKNPLSVIPLCYFLLWGLALGVEVRLVLLDVASAAKVESSTTLEAVRLPEQGRGSGKAHCNQSSGFDSISYLVQINI